MTFLSSHIYLSTLVSIYASMTRILPARYERLEGLETIHASLRKLQVCSVDNLTFSRHFLTNTGERRRNALLKDRDVQAAHV